MDTDVIIVGAGPTGLMLAAELRLGGARVVVVERLAKPTGQSRGLGFTARAMEIFDQRGLLPRFGQGETLEISPMGHFGGVQFDYTVLEGGHFGARGIPQYKTEAVLEEWAAELGVDIRRGWDFLELTDGFLDGDDVEITVQTPNAVRKLRASYLVGADGGRSVVREAAGVRLPGHLRDPGDVPRRRHRLRAAPALPGGAAQQRHGDGGPARPGRGPDHRLPRQRARPRQRRVGLLRGGRRRLAVDHR